MTEERSAKHNTLNYLPPKNIVKVILVVNETRLLSCETQNGSLH